MPLGTTISYIIIAIIIGALFGGIIRIIRRNSNNKKQDLVEQKLDRVIQLLEKQNKDWPYLQTGVVCSNLKMYWYIGVIHMQRYIIMSITSILFITQLSILYFWIVDWQRVVTQTGLIIWASSILVGILLYLMYRKSNRRFLSITRRIVFVCTSATILLAMLTLLIKITVSSMP